MNEPAAHEFERRASIARDHEGNIVGYYLDADLWREVRARLAAVWDEGWRAGADDQKGWSDKDVPGSVALTLAENPYRAAVVADPADTTR